MIWMMWTCLEVIGDSWIRISASVRGYMYDESLEWLQVDLSAFFVEKLEEKFIFKEPYYLILTFISLLILSTNYHW